MKDSMAWGAQSLEKPFGARVSAPGRGAFRPTNEHVRLGERRGATAPATAEETRNHHARR